MSYPVCIARKVGRTQVEFLDAKGYNIKKVEMHQEVTGCSANGGTVVISLANGQTHIYDANSGYHIRTV